MASPAAEIYDKLHGVQGSPLWLCGNYQTVLNDTKERKLRPGDGGAVVGGNRELWELWLRPPYCRFMGRIECFMPGAGQ